MAKRSKLIGSRELKTRLGTYLDRVKRGETLVVTDRGVPVAELRPITTSDDPVEAALDRMAAQGLITRATKKGPLTKFKPLRLPPGVSIVDALLKDREEGW